MSASNDQFSFTRTALSTYGCAKRNYSLKRKGQPMMSHIELEGRCEQVNSSKTNELGADINKRLAGGRGRHLIRCSEWVVSSLAALMLGVGCASTGSDRDGPRPRDGIAEYRQVAADARKAMHAALSSLAEVSAQSNRCAPKALSAFSAEMQRLQVDSIPLRARAQAMQARGDAYFERWHEHLARVKDPEVRAIAERQRPVLEESFGKIKAMSQEGREAFDPFQASLRKVRNALETDPASISTGPTRNSIASAKQNGEHVERCLDGIISELDSMRAMLTPSGSRAKQQKAR